MNRTSVVLLLISLAFISCRSQDLIRPGDTLEVAYDKAFSQFQNENYSQAADAFETVISIGRGTTMGQDAQFYLSESYFISERYLLAATEYQRYVQFHPNSERRQEAEFKEALSYYHLSPRFRLDQTYTNQAINGFRLFLSRYPDSEFSEQSAEYITELLDKLARRDYNAAEFYMRTNRFDAAAIYYNQIIDRFPGSSMAEESLVKQIEAYILYAENSVPARQEERYEKALDSYSTYLQLFPQGENRSKAEDLYDTATRHLEEIRSRAQVVQN